MTEAGATTPDPGPDPAPGPVPDPARPTADDASEPRSVLVFGASSGIGRATAHALAERGDRLGLVSRSPEALDAVRRECVDRGATDVAVLPCDVRDRPGVEKVLDEAVSRWGRVDGVVAAAAVLAYGRFEEIPADVFDATVTTNVLGTANVARSALRVFRNQDGGNLAVLGSVLGKMTAPYMSPYATSKWAVHALVRTLQIEARRLPGVGITLVSPGGVDTPIYHLAGSYTGTGAAPPPPVEAPEKVADKVVEALDRPRREISVGLANPVMVLGFRVLPRLFDTLVTPLMDRLGQSKDRVDAHPGNVFEPRPKDEALRGTWPRRFLR